jgi:hypothetical protein
MKRTLYFLGLLAGLMLACNIPSTATPTTVTQPAVVITDTPVVVTPVMQANVTCNNVSLYLDPALASGFQCQTVAEVSGAGFPGFSVNPQYTEITFQGYVLADRFFTPHVDVYPVQRFTEIAPDVNIPSRVSALQALIGGGAPGTDALPLLPIFNAAQEFYAHYQVVPFGTGSGIRYLTEYSQYADPVNNHEMFYSYQGLTADGKDWISAILPVSLAGLPDNGDNPPAGQTPEQFSNNFPTYIADMTTKLNAHADGDFSPTLKALDNLVGSLQVTP